MSSYESSEEWEKEPKQAWETCVEQTTVPIYTDLDPANNWTAATFKPIVRKRSPRYCSGKGMPKDLQDQVKVRWSGLFDISRVDKDVTIRTCRAFGVESGLYNFQVRAGIHNTTGGGDDKRRDPKGYHITIRVYANDDVDQGFDYETIHLYVCRLIDGGKEMEELPAGRLDDDYPHWDEIGFWWDSWRDTDTLLATSSMVHSGISEVIEEIGNPGVDSLGWPIRENWALEMDGFASMLFEEERIVKANKLEIVAMPKSCEAFMEAKTFEVPGVAGPLMMTIKRGLVREKRNMGHACFYYVAVAIKDGLGGLVVRGWRRSTRFEL